MKRVLSLSPFPLSSLLYSQSFISLRIPSELIVRFNSTVITPSSSSQSAEPQLAQQEQQQKKDLESTSVKAAEKLPKKSTFPLEKDKSSSGASLLSTRCVNQLISDNNGLPLFLYITEDASAKLKEIIEKDNNPKLALRIQVESGGCHGFQYNLKLVDDYEKEFNAGKDAKDDNEDSMFVRDGNARVIIDKMSLEILRDSKVDYVHELIGSQFKVTESPYTTSSCGCGASFDFDFDKLNKDGSSA